MAQLKKQKLTLGTINLNTLLVLPMLVATPCLVMSNANAQPSFNEFIEASHITHDDLRDFHHKDFSEHVKGANTDYIQTRPSVMSNTRPVMVEERADLEFEEVETVESIQISDYFYAGLAYGNIKSRLDLLNDSQIIVDNKDKVMTGFAGYQFTPNISVEFNLSDLGEVVTSGGNGLNRSSTAFMTAALLAQPSVAITDSFRAMLRMGLGYSEIDDGAHYLNRQSQKTGVWGAGVEYRLNDRLGVRATFDHYSELEADVAAIGAFYRFGGDNVEQEEMVLIDQPMQMTAAPMMAATGKAPLMFRDVFFATNSAKLSEGTVAKLDRALAVLKQHKDLSIQLRGFADVRASKSYNQALSERRVQSVQSYLTNAGISVNRVNARAMGEGYGGRTLADLAQDRRVELRAGL